MLKIHFSQNDMRNMMLIQQTLIQYLLQKKNLCEIFKVLTIWGNINLFIRPQHQQIIKSKGALSDYVWQSSFYTVYKENSKIFWGNSRMLNKEMTTGTKKQFLGI